MFPEASPENADDSEGNEADKKVHLHAGDQIQVVMAYHFMLKNKVFIALIYLT